MGPRHLPVRCRWPDCSETTGTIYVHEQRANDGLGMGASMCNPRRQFRAFCLAPAILICFDIVLSQKKHGSLRSLHICSTGSQSEHWAPSSLDLLQLFLDSTTVPSRVGITPGDDLRNSHGFLEQTEESLSSPSGLDTLHDPSLNLILRFSGLDTLTMSCIRLRAAERMLGSSVDQVDHGTRWIFEISR